MSRHEAHVTSDGTETEMKTEMEHYVVDTIYLGLILQCKLLAVDRRPSE